MPSHLQSAEPGPSQVTTSNLPVSLRITGDSLLSFTTFRLLHLGDHGCHNGPSYVRIAGYPVPKTTYPAEVRVQPAIAIRNIPFELRNQQNDKIGSFQVV